MTRKEKKMKAAAIAVSVYMEQETLAKPVKRNAWGEASKSIIMSNRDFVQRKQKSPNALR